jgi:hypothetical protein
MEVSWKIISSIIKSTCMILFSGVVGCIGLDLLLMVFNGRTYFGILLAAYEDIFLISTFCLVVVSVTTLLRYYFYGNDIFNK